MTVPSSEAAGRPVATAAKTGSYESVVDYSGRLRRRTVELCGDVVVTASESSSTNTCIAPVDFSVTDNARVLLLDTLHVVIR